MKKLERITKVKICGITNTKDALTAVKYGADALGFVFASSRRKITLKKARQIISQLPPFINTVGVFMDQSLEYVRKAIDLTGIDLVQLHGNETSEYCNRLSKGVIKGIQVNGGRTVEDLLSLMGSYRVSAFILDSGAGSGKTFNWEILSEIKYPLIIAGGLTPQNVGKLIKRFQPYAVDVSSGVENLPGKKDEDKMKRFIQEVKYC
ncbi:MAG: phosphoribosylanthranilate isomerase [bacterium]